jgi:hypothetical protein
MEESTNSQSSSEPSSDNVIPFRKRVTEKVADSETPEITEKANREFLNEYVHDLALNLLSEFHEEGFDIQSKVFDKNFGFVVESMRSMLYATYDIEHPFQEIVDKCVKLIDEIDETEHANDDEEFNQS